jgi:hypothetical protein
MSVATNGGLASTELAAALGDVVREAVMNHTAAAEDQAAVWINTTIDPYVSGLAGAQGRLEKGMVPAD